MFRVDVGSVASVILDISAAEVIEILLCARSSIG